jgi:hypothetical protein
VTVLVCVKIGAVYDFWEYETAFCSPLSLMVLEKIFEDLVNYV